MDDFHWNGTSERAAQLVADGNLTYSQIADQSGIARETLWKWRKHPGFVARVDAHLDEIRAEVRRIGLADVERRVRALNDRWGRLQRIIEARADDPQVQDEPGGTTGLLLKTTRTRRNGDNVDVEVECRLDTDLLRELREHEKQAAQELGQWTERKQIDDARKAYDVGNTPDEL